MIGKNNSHYEINEILNSTIEGIMLVENGFILNVNDAFTDILGYEKDDVIGNLASGCLLPFNRKKFIEFNHSKFQEVSLISKDVKIVPAIIKVKNIKYENNDVLMVSILDLTSLKEKENLLVRQSKMAAMGEMLSMIAHQWRQPLNAIATTLTSMKFKILKHKELKPLDKKVDKINEYLQFMSTTIDEFKDFYKDGNHIDLIDLNSTVKQAATFFESSLHIKNIDLKIENSTKTRLYTNKNHIIQVLINIINNAIEAITQNNINKGFIKLGFIEESNFVTIYIKDNAGGISKDIKDKIFEPYFTTKEKSNGTGFGLYMSKLIMEKNNYGELLVNDLEKGSCFKIKLKV